jgi:AcrR family transcriptional regulator
MAQSKQGARPHRRGPGRLSAENAEKLPERLLEAAASQFLAKGYARTTMEGIARAAGASTKTVYSRYHGKGEILAAVIRRLVETTISNLQLGIDALHSARAPEDFLSEIGKRFATLVTSPQTVGINRLVLSEAAQFPELATIFSEGPGRAVGIIRMELERWQSEGRLSDVPSAQLAATIFYDMTTSTPRLRALLGSPMSKGEISRHIAAAVALFLRGCEGSR